MLDVVKYFKIYFQKLTCQKDTVENHLKIKNKKKPKLTFKEKRELKRKKVKKLLKYC